MVRVFSRDSKQMTPLVFSANLHANKDEKKKLLNPLAQQLELSHIIIRFSDIELAFSLLQPSPLLSSAIPQPPPPSSLPAAAAPAVGTMAYASFYSFRTSIANLSVRTVLPPLPKPQPQPQPPQGSGIATQGRDFHDIDRSLETGIFHLNEATAQHPMPPLRLFYEDNTGLETLYSRVPQTWHNDASLHARYGGLVVGRDHVHRTIKNSLRNTLSDGISWPSWIKTCKDGKGAPVNFTISLADHLREEFRKYNLQPNPVHIINDLDANLLGDNKTQEGQMELRSIGSVQSRAGTSRGVR
ncbi:hypothetical protein F4679DRAFT_587405 [Xylaria curta]|nr:hypothetical protein F4679DRAFT_587405 [Xylaria curta]